MVFQDKVKMKMYRIVNQIMKGNRNKTSYRHHRPQGQVKR